MTVNFKGQNPAYIALEALPVGKKAKNTNKTVYINPNAVGVIEPSSKKARTGDSYALNDSDKLTESKITLTNGQEFYVSLGAKETATRLSEGARIENLILNYNA